MKPLRMLTLLGIFCATLGFSPPPTHFKVESRGVGGGGALFCPTFNPHNNDELFMATDMSAVFHSKDAGRSWTTLHFKTLQGGTLSQFRYTSNPNIMYAISFDTNNRTLAKSTDAGVTWQVPVVSPGQANAAHFLFVDPTNPNRLLVSDFANLFFSNDGAQSFRQVYATSWAGGLVIAGAFWNGDAIVVATSDGMLSSTDGGASFTLDTSFGGIPATEKIVSFTSASNGHTTRFFALTFTASDDGGDPLVTADITGGDVDAYAGLYRLDHGSKQWQGLNTGLTAGQKLAFVAMSARNTDVVYAAGMDEDADIPLVIKSVNGGGRWASIFKTTHNENIRTGWSGYNGDVGWDFGEFAEGFTVSPSSASHVAFTDLGFIHLSDDGGSTWRQGYVQPQDEHPAGADTPPSRHYTTAGVEQTTTWWLNFIDRNTRFASVTDISSERSTDGGKTWTRNGRDGLTFNTNYRSVTHPMTGAIYAAVSSIHDIYESPYLRESRLDSADAAGGVMVSTNKGATWTMLHDFGHPVVWVTLDPRHPDSLYASVVNSAEGDIYRIDLANPAAPPLRLPTPPRTKGHPFNVHVLNDGGIVATYSGHQTGGTRVFEDRSGVFYLPAGATAWADRSSPPMHYWTRDIVLDPHDPSQNTWYVAVFSHQEEGSVGILDGGLYRTRDRGLTWQRINDFYRVGSCGIDPDRPDRLYLSTEMNGLWVTDNLNDATPTFHLVDEYPFRQPGRIIWNPFDHREIWVMNFGGGMRVMTPSADN